MSLEAGWANAEAFVSHLQDIIEQESEAIRETEYTSPGHPVPATVKTKGRKGVYGEVWKDRLGRVYLDSRFYGKTIEWIQFGTELPRRVVKVEERFKGERPSKVVCYLEER